MIGVHLLLEALVLRVILRYLLRYSLGFGVRDDVRGVLSTGRASSGRIYG